MKNKLSFAERAKQIQKKFEGRDDSISRATMMHQLSLLKAEQEAARVLLEDRNKAQQQSGEGGQGDPAAAQQQQATQQQVSAEEQLIAEQAAASQPNVNQFSLGGGRDRFSEKAILEQQKIDYDREQKKAAALLTEQYNQQVLNAGGIPKLPYDAIGNDKPLPYDHPVNHYMSGNGKLISPLSKYELAYGQGYNETHNASNRGISTNQKPIVVDNGTSSNQEPVVVNTESSNDRVVNQEVETNKGDNTTGKGKKIDLRNAWNKATGAIGKLSDADKTLLPRLAPMFGNISELKNLERPLPNKLIQLNESDISTDRFDRLAPKKDIINDVMNYKALLASKSDGNINNLMRGLSSLATTKAGLLNKVDMTANQYDTDRIREERAMRKEYAIKNAEYKIYKDENDAKDKAAYDDTALSLRQGIYDNVAGVGTEYFNKYTSDRLIDAEKESGMARAFTEANAIKQQERNTTIAAGSIDMKQENPGQTSSSRFLSEQERAKKAKEDKKAKDKAEKQSKAKARTK